MESYRASPPKELNGVKICGFKDFGRETFKDADGKRIPSQDFYFLDLENGYQYAVRGSGTEPKIKFYVFAKESVKEASELAEVKEKTIGELEKLKAAIEADARLRAGE